MMFGATPTPPPDFDLNSVTPGWVGFAITASVALVTVILILDMVRRIRRVRYRAEVRERLEGEATGDTTGESSHPDE